MIPMCVHLSFSQTLCLKSQRFVYETTFISISLSSVQTERLIRMCVQVMKVFEEFEKKDCCTSSTKTSFLIVD